MIPYLGDYKEDETIYLMFNTFTSDDPSASCTITNFANTDVHIHKDDGLTQRNNAAGITVSVDFDGITGSHMVKIDTNDNTVAGFWVTGSDYFVRIEGTTVDAATINSVVAHFSIENRNMRGTDSAALATGVNMTQISGDTTAANNLELYCDGTTAQPVNVTELGGVVQSLTDIKDFADTGYDPVAHYAFGVTTCTTTTTNTDMVGTNGANTVIPDAEGVAPTAVEIRTEIDSNSTRLDADMSSRSTVTTAQVNAEVADVMKVDVTAEMAQAAPPATPTMEEMMAYIYFRLRNKCTTTATEDAMWDNAGTTKLIKSVVSDDGSTLTKNEYTSGA